MRYKILLYGLLAAVVSSCSSVYKASQTPDDVYYSPAREGVQKQTAKRDRYEDYLVSEDDQYLRMKIRNRDRWSGIDDYSYWNDSRYVPMYNYNYDYYRNNAYNSYALNNWNRPYSAFYYNPYSLGYGGGFGGGIYMNNYYPRYSYGYNPYGGATYINKSPARTIAPSINRPGLNSYRNGLYENRNNQNAGNTLKRVFSANENARTYSNENNRSYNNENTYSAPQRTYTPSSSSSSSGNSSSGSSGGGVTRPPRQ